MEEEQTSKARPMVIPKSTYAPLLLAVSVLFMGWGLLTTWLITAAGAVGFFIALAEWIKELMYERIED